MQPTSCPTSIAQVVGAIAAAAALYWIASGKPGWVPAGFAANGYGDLSPGKYSMGACLAMEVLMTFFFLLIIIGSHLEGRRGGLRRHTRSVWP